MFSGVEQMGMPASLSPAAARLALLRILVNWTLLVHLNSSEATELQRVLISSGLLPDVEAQMESYGLELGGQLAFNGTLRGKLGSPDMNGRVSLGSLLVNGNDLGSLSTDISMTQ